jgi:hypothetical protein
MTVVTETDIKEQLPPGAQKSIGNTKEVAGVIDESIGGDSDVLLNQARLMARARRGVMYEGGGDFSDEFVQRYLVRTPKEYINRSLSADTIQALMQGSQSRDQQYIGNNADWTGYYLEPLAKFVVPFDTPFRNMLPRTPSVGIDVENWRAITSVFNGTGPDVTSFILNQQSSPTKQQYVWVNKSNLLRQIARSDIVTDESEIYGRMFEPDVRAKVAAKLAPTLMVGQETWYLNSAQAMWSPPPANTPSTASSGGALSNATYWIIVTAVNANGETLAWSISPASQSAPQALSIAVTGGGSANTISFNIMRIPNTITGGSGAGGWSYHVYIGTGATQPANSAMWLQAATLFVNNTNPSLTGSHALDDPGGFSAGYFNVTLTGALATSGTAYSSVVSAGNTAVVASSGGGGTPANQPLTFDGIQSLVYLNAGALSSVGEGGEIAVVRRVADSGGALAKSDIDAWLEVMYFNSRANPEAILCGIKDHKALSNIVMNATNFRVNTTPDQAGLANLTGGGRATKWINQTTGRLMDIIMCPYLTQGTLIAVSLTLPFTVAEIDKPPLRVSVNREMWSREYPPDQSHPTQWMYAAFGNETLVAQFLGGQGVLTGIVTA